MPNYVKNLVYARNKTEELIAAFKGKDADGNEQEVTFNAIIPTPEDVYQGPVGESSPANNWYAFNTENWGTKWDACDGNVCYDHVEFNTASSTPEPVIKALAKKLNDAGAKRNGVAWPFGDARRAAAERWIAAVNALGVKAVHETVTRGPFSEFCRKLLDGNPPK